MKAALTFRASSIGDSLMGKYLLENVHAQYPDARCVLVVTSRGDMIRNLLATYRWLEVREVNRSDLRGLLRLWRDFRNSDLVVTQYAGKGGKFGLGAKLAARLLARRGRLIGFVDASNNNRFLYDRLLPFDPKVAMAEHERQALRAAGLPICVPYPTLSAIPDSAVLKKFDVTAGRYVVVHPFSGSIKRALSPAHRKELIAALGVAMPGVTLLVSGNAKEAAEAEIACENSGARVIAGKATLQEMTQLVLQSGCVVSLDTGIAHITAQLRRPVLVISICLGRAWWKKPEQYGPDIPAGFYNHSECASGHVFKDYPDCLNAVDLQEVARAASKFLV